MHINSSITYIFPIATSEHKSEKITIYQEYKKEKQQKRKKYMKGKENTNQENYDS